MEYYGYSLTPNDFYFAHHGIKDQKWGVRRFQNPDGTWTEAGKKRYGGGSSLGSVNPTNNGIIRRIATGDHPIGYKRLADKYEEHLRNKVEKQKAAGKDYSKTEAKYERQKQMNIDRDKYLSNTKTGKILAQNFLMGGIGAHLYRNARARNEDRVNAFLAPLLGSAVGVPVALAVDSYKKQEAYKNKTANNSTSNKPDMAKKKNPKDVGSTEMQKQFEKYLNVQGTKSLVGGDHTKDKSTEVLTKFNQEFNKRDREFKANNSELKKRDRKAYEQQRTDLESSLTKEYRNKYAEAILKDMGYDTNPGSINWLMSQPWFGVKYKNMTSDYFK